jgi:phosphopentomutase
MPRFIFIVLDGAGVGALPDAGEWGDEGSDTLGNLSRVVGLALPNFARLGLGNIEPLLGVLPTADPLCLPGRLAPLSAGKDTTVGHWEHMGLVTAEPFPTYPAGFPEEIIDAFRAAIGRDILGNKPASGTAIIAELGEEHLATGNPIVYTSADSVFQIAAHVEVVPLELLYSWCRAARELLQGPHAVARVIARPFTGPVGAFVRTKDRRDFSLEPPGPTYLDVLQQAGVPVLALGKVAEVFVYRGVSAKIRVGSNEENLALVVALLQGRAGQVSFEEGLLLTNLVDFDMVWGHRNDIDGFTRGLEAVDAALPCILEALHPDDRLLITADHGVDPTTPSTDHSREYVPLLLYPRPADAPAAVYEGWFSDTGATVCKYLTGADPRLGGSVITALEPARGWRRSTSVVRVSGPAPGGPDAGERYIPSRVGPEEAEEAANWLAQNLGEAPDVAMILGSGLKPDLPLEADAPPPDLSPGIGTADYQAAQPQAEIAYESIPHWPGGSVEGHPQKLRVVRWRGLRVALLQGRAHEYEGRDLGEVQLPVRALAAWGTRKLITTTASGAVGDMLVPGEVVPVGRVLDFQYPRSDGSPALLDGTDVALLATLGWDGAGADAAGATHASVGGPQYETPAELAVLRALGAQTVSMSPAAEVRAAHDEGMALAVLAVVANAGDTTHAEVLAGTARAGKALGAAIGAVLTAWAPPGA